MINDIITLPGKIKKIQVEGLELGYSEQYLTTEALDDGNISFIIDNNINTDLLTSISYSVDDGTTWTTIDNEDDKEDIIQIDVDVNEGDKVLWKGNALALSDGQSSSSFVSNIQINVYGNIMSLLYGDNFINQTSLPDAEDNFNELFAYTHYGSVYAVDVSNLILPATTLTYNCYSLMFYGCTSLTSAPKLPATTLEQGCYSSMFQGCSSLTSAPELPATTLAQGCYNSMFKGCSSLTSAPELPATTLTYNCYNGMFYGCTSLTSAPKLPATTLKNGCYGSMFLGCTSLTTAPELPATTLTSSCYNGMFSGCTSLNYIKCLATNISATYCTYEWVNGVAASGTFVKANGMSSWTTGNNGIPSGWTTYTEYEYEYAHNYQLNPNMIVETTYSNLVSLRNNNNLASGVWYRITNYGCTTTQANTKSAGHQFDILVLATSINTLSEEARAIQHDGDSYFSNSNLNAWKIWYCLDNDTSKFTWADSTNGKGVIYRMIDDNNNDCPYDFKNIMFSSAGWYYTFNNASSDFSLNKNCYSNVMKSRIASNKLSLNFNIFKCSSNTSSCYSNIFGNNCYSNTFGTNCTNNKFGNGCSYNTFGDSCYSNTFGTNCTYNTFGYTCYYNKFGNGCTNNKFGNNCYYNTFGNSYNSNTFGNSCSYNTFGTSCTNNKFRDSCIYNTFGNGCDFNTFGYSCTNNTFGNSCAYNAFGNIEIADSIINITPISYVSYNILDNGCSNLVIKCTQTTSSSLQCKNIHILQGVKGSYESKKIINIDTVGNDYALIIEAIGTQTITV